MENNDINDKTNNLDLSIQDSITSTIKWFENKNPFSMLILIITAWLKISNWINELIKLINFDNNEAHTHVILWLSYDLLWKEEGNDFIKNNKNKNIKEILKELWKKTNWTIEFKEWILKEHIDLFKKDELEQKNIIFEYYKIEILWMIQLLKDIHNKKTKHKEKYDELKNKEYYNDIWKIIAWVNEWKDKEILKTLKNNIELRNDIENYYYSENNIDLKDINKLELKINWFKNKINEVNLKRVIINAIVIPNFAENIYGNILLSLFSNIIMKKLVIKISKNNWNILKDENYKIFKNICKYLVVKDESQKIYIEKFFQEFEDNIGKIPSILESIKNKFDNSNILLIIFITLVFILFWNYLFLDNIYFEKIISVTIWFLILFFLHQFTTIKNILIWWLVAFSLWILFFSNLSNYMYSSVLNNNTINKPQIILLSKDNLYFSWSIVSATNNEDIWKFIDFLFLQYEDRLWIKIDKVPLLKEKIKMEYAQENDIKIDKINLWELEKIVQKNISK